MPDPLLMAQSRLTERDHTLLSWLYDHGVLTTFQIAHALFPSLDFAQRRLTKLRAMRMVDRFRAQKPGGGSYPYHYVLDQLGAEFVASQRIDEMPGRAEIQRHRRILTNRANLPHLLGINQFLTDLAGHARTHPRTSLDRWWSTTQCGVGGAFSDQGHIASYLPVRPDGHGIWTDGDRQVRFWFEYDNSTEPHGTLVQKVVRYGTALSRLEVNLLAWPLLFSLSTAARERTLHRQLAGIDVKLPVATTTRELDAATGRSPAEDVWWLHRHQGPLLRLADLAGRR